MSRGRIEKRRLVDILPTRLHLQSSFPGRLRELSGDSRPVSQDFSNWQAWINRTATLIEHDFELALNAEPNNSLQLKPDLRTMKARLFDSFRPRNVMTAGRLMHRASAPMMDLFKMRCISSMLSHVAATCRWKWRLSRHLHRS